MAELADALDLGSSGKPWGFKSSQPHHIACLRQGLGNKSEEQGLRSYSFLVIKEIEMIKKNETYRVEVIDQGFEGEGIAKIDDMTVFIEGALAGEVVEILIVKVLSSFAYGKLLKVIKKSNSRAKEDCASFKRCGGCSLRHMSYNASLELKKKTVENCFYKALHRQVNVQDCIGMENPIGYRNKLIYPVRI